MGTSGTENRRTHRQRRNRQGCFRLRCTAFQSFQIPDIGFSQILFQNPPDRLHGVFTGGLHFPCKLALYFQRQMVPAAKKQQLLFQNRIQFLHSHHLVQSFCEFQKQTLWHGIGGGYLKHPCSSVSVQGFHDKLIADAMSDDALDRVSLFPMQQIEPVA